jgi:hypothetical protein
MMHPLVKEALCVFALLMTIQIAIDVALEHPFLAYDAMMILLCGSVLAAALLFA